METAGAGACMSSCFVTSVSRPRIAVLHLRSSAARPLALKRSIRVPLLRCSLPSASNQEEGASSRVPGATSSSGKECYVHAAWSLHHATSKPLLMPSGAELSALRMPTLQCSFPSLLHPQYETVREQCEEWILAVAQPPSAASRRFLLDCTLPRLVCRVIPNASASVQRLVYATKMVSWLFIADDDDDHPDALGSNYAATAHRADTIMAILRQPCPNHEYNDSTFRAKLQALVPLWDEIYKEMSPCLRDRFISTMADYFEGMKVQAAFRKAKCVPSVKDYMEIRRQSSFTLPAFVFLEFVLGLELDEAIYNNPLLIELHNIVRDFINLCNDIISCPIEIGVGDYFNLPSILYTTKDASFPCSSFQEALDLAAHMAHDLNAHYLSILPSVHSSLLKDAPSLCAYVDALSTCMSGSLAWSLETARYNDPSTRSELYQPTCMHGKQTNERH